MSHAFGALTWELLARMRWLTGSAFLYYALLCLVMPLIPVSAKPQSWKVWPAGSSVAMCRNH